MSKRTVQGEEGTWRTRFFDLPDVDDETVRGDPVDPDEITFLIKSPDGVVTEIVGSEFGDHGDDDFVGRYEASFVFDEWGRHEWKWITENPRIVKQGHTDVDQSNVDDPTP